MAFDFPTSPSIGDTYPVTPSAGVPVYRWDSEKWTTIGGVVNGKPPVYADGSVPMKAQLTVVNPPVNPTDAAAKAYVDAADSLAWSIAPQTLTAAQQVQTRQNTHAAPCDAAAFSGMQINGGMEVSQQRGTGAATASFSYTVDGWIQSRIGTASIETKQGLWSTGGFSNILDVTVMTAQASFTGNQGVWILQYIEGYRIARLGWGTPNAQPITIGFWTSCTQTGTYTGSIRNNMQGSATRSYAFTYTKTTGILQYYTITIPGDTAGTWNRTDGIGLMLTLSLACGPTYTAPSAGVWLNGDYAAAPGQVNAVASLAQLWRLTGVIVLPGAEAPSTARAPYIMRPYPQELITCSRYFQFNRYGEQGYLLSGTQGVFFHSPVVPYRSAPSMGITASSSVYMEVPYQVGITVTNPSIIAGHMAATGGDYRISGSYNASSGQDYTLGIYTQNVQFDARL